MYMETGILTAESDVYSFGVVLFEVLCSRLSIDSSYNDQRRSLAILVKKCYKKRTLDTIINVDLRQQMEQNCFDMFAALAYQCLRRDPEKRPSMGLVVNKLATALEYQEGFLTETVEANESESESEIVAVTAATRARDRARAKARGKAKAKARARATEVN
ncbi:hypothetical protein L1887_27779 [Cichorium endivia]|nr:hypothetical protein L1887_27779 [Cichorium endivia]